MGLLVLAVLLWTMSRFWPLPAAQREQVRWLEDVRPLPGKDGFALLWTLPFDGLDRAQREAALAEDVRHWQVDPAPDRTDSVLAATHPEVKVDSQGYCRSTGESCLAKVRADTAQFRAVHAGHEGLHERLDALADADRFDTPFLPSGSPGIYPWPRYQTLMDASGVHALAFVRGDVPAALAGSCRSVQVGRRLMHGGNTLIDSMIGAAMVRANVHLLAEMLAELPPDQVMPAACESALQPMDAAEQSLCRPMQGEFAMSRAAIDASLQQTGTVLMLDREHTLGRFAANFGWACGSGSEAALQADRPVEVVAGPDWDMRCLANVVGCTLSDISGPAYQDYAARSQDVAALLRLLGAQRWLRQQPEGPQQALQRLPAQWRSSTRVPVLSADGTRLQVQRRARDAGGKGDAMLSVSL
ncbi:hypothetical protein C1925_14770 [Stenotrophomonas sp. SAU14A_NAIMI4_5]|nr:hypothetical protein C1925_14770 [Stenotrophomonas sp. SAU14A_NAIMI4_5]